MGIERGAFVAALERSAAEAWPALDSEVRQGWLCRSAGGYTQRANSCLPLDDPSIGWERRIASVEAYFQAKDQPALFKMPGEPLWASLDTELEARGYSVSTPSRVLSKAASAEEVPPGFRAGEQFDELWWQGYQSASSLPAAHGSVARALASQVSRPVVGRVTHGTEEAAWAFVSLVGDQAWVFDVVVDPAFRGRGLGRSLMVGLEAEAARRGVKTLHLQVLAVNTVANSLYESLGYRQSHLYHYRRQP